MKLTVLAASCLVLPVLLSAAPAEAASPVLIGKTQYDSPGTDNRSATSLNAEYVTLKNVTRSTVQLKGWTLRDKSNHVYTFTTAFSLAGGASVVIHTGRGTNSAGHRYWGSGAYVWNNDGDAATLRNAAGSTLDSCSWRGGSPGYTAC